MIKPSPQNDMVPCRFTQSYHTRSVPLEFCILKTGYLSVTEKITKTLTLKGDYWRIKMTRLGLLVAPVYGRIFFMVSQSWYLIFDKKKKQGDQSAKFEWSWRRHARLATILCESLRYIWEWIFFSFLCKHRSLDCPLIRKFII